MVTKIRNVTTTEKFTLVFHNCFNHLGLNLCTGTISMITAEQMIARMKSKRESLREERTWSSKNSINNLLVLKGICFLNDLISEFESYNR